MTMHFHNEVFNTMASRAAAAALDPKTRRRMVKFLIAEYPAFVEATEIIKRFHFSEAAREADTGQIGGVIGEFRSGKSWLIRNYLQRYPRIQTEAQIEIPALYIEAKGNWGTKDLPRNIIAAISRPITGNKSPAILSEIAVARMMDLKVRLLVIDDFHKLLGRRADVAEAAFELIRSAVDQDVCNVLLCGPQIVQKAIADRDELMWRGGFPFAPVRAFDRHSEDGEAFFTLFLQMVDDRLPFARPSDLAQDPINAELLAVSNGSIGFVMALIKAAAKAAIEDNSPCISVMHLRRALQDRGALLLRDAERGESEEETDE